MKHIDPTVLALASLGEQLDDDDRRHLGECSECAAELDGLLRVTETARSERALQFENPEPGVWARVHQGLGLSADSTADPLSDDGVRETGRADSRQSSRGEPGAAAGELEARRTERDRRRNSGRSQLWLAAAAAAGIIVGGGAVWGVSQSNQGESPDVLAQTQLEPLPGYQTSGEVKITEGGQGTRMLAVTAPRVQTEGYREVWLISEDLEQMYSLGVLAGKSGSFAIPEGVELSQFPIVDISNEPTDGNPEHSGDSILRGTLAQGNSS
ncbi:anti-sigma factor domain-containing protein [Arthrobacter pigmenti]